MQLSVHPQCPCFVPWAGSLRPNTRDFRAVRKQSGNTDVTSTHDAYTMLKPTNDTHQQTDGNFLLVSGDKLVVPELRKEVIITYVRAVCQQGSQQ